MRFVKFLNTSAKHGRNVHKENDFFYVSHNRYRFVILSTGLLSEHKDESKFVGIIFTVICRSPGDKR